jgi:hypothetical protein
MDTLETYQSVLDQIQWLKTEIHPKWYQPTRTLQVSVCGSVPVQFFLKFQKLFKTSKIHIFHTTCPKITNFMSLESLGSVESISTIKSLGFSIKSRMIFQIDLSPYFVHLIYIFCSTSPIHIFL